MKKFLCVLAAAMCSATFILSACSFLGGDSSVSNDSNTDYTDITDDGEENTNGSSDEEIAGDSKEDVELTEVSVAEAYELLSAFNEKFQSAVESNYFNMIFEADSINTSQYSNGEEITEYSFNMNIDAKCMYDGQYFYGDFEEKFTDEYGYSQYSLMYRDAQRVYNKKSITSYDNIEQSVSAYKSEALSLWYEDGLYILQRLQYYEAITADYDVDYQSTVKIYSETNYINIVLSYTASDEYNKISYALNLKINLAAGLTADDFEPLSVE